MLEAHLGELLGIVRGVVADGRIAGEEASHLVEWLRSHPDLGGRWPVDLLSRRLEEIFRDGRVEGRETRILESILGQLADHGQDQIRAASDLPVDRPTPAVQIPSRTFVFAGPMAYGSVRACRREVEELGGLADPVVTRRTDYLVIGALAAEDGWQRSFGEQVDAVVQYRGRGARIAIVDEGSWTAALS